MEKLTIYLASYLIELQETPHDIMMDMRQFIQGHYVGINVRLSRYEIGLLYNYLKDYLEDKNVD